MTETLEEREARVKEMADRLKVGDVVYLVDLKVKATCVDEGEGIEPKFQITLNIPAYLENFQLDPETMSLYLLPEADTKRYLAEATDGSETLMVEETDAYLERKRQRHQ